MSPVKIPFPDREALLSVCRREETERRRVGAADCPGVWGGGAAWTMGVTEGGVGHLVKYGCRIDHFVLFCAHSIVGRGHRLFGIKKTKLHWAPM